ncbi:nitrate ABC transporter ATP-binding protein [Sinomonas cellulolyticus]|uniref:ABC transporter ATP-binding protein n=1 Tax=Sinomonas cellulolyticus TaxID=2801916 RepID=A0ABS1K8J7_9MICC|nr:MULTISPECIES: ABC transporter ATP-binding protein [Sinomonas]MBL0706646.1 ABC transporter ATP-binding protein [Sinomonas cellulolyticus]GHG60864.1 nitrate ABC transporter ATP-binding protein [Sinomonas sp. KCTC 49339]
MTSPMLDRQGAPAAPHLALAADRVSEQFGAGAPVLENVSLTVEHGEFVAIVGPSGCGKTTLLRIIQGLEAATSGAVTTRSRTGEAPRMSYVFQRASLLPWYTVRDNVAFGVTLRAGNGIYGSKRERDNAVADLLALTGLTKYADFYPDQISGGMQQRVNVARALAVRPDVLLLDEPLSALDALTRERLQIDVARILEQVGTTGILVTHDIREAVFLSDRIAVMAAHPGRTRAIVDVDFPRPRTPEFQHSTELAQLERGIWEMLH